MDEDFSIEVEGLEETLAALDAMSDDLARRVIQPSLVAASAPVVEAVAAHTPILTGDLIKHLKVTVKMDKQEKGGNAKISFPGMEGIASAVEFGHRAVGHEPDLKDTGIRVPAHPFVRPAFEESKEAAVEAFKTTADPLIDQLAVDHGFSNNEAA